MKFAHAWRRVQLFFADDLFIYLRPKHAPEDWLGALFYFGQLLTGFREQVVPDLNDQHFWRVFHLRDPRSGEKRMWRILWRPDYGYVVPVGHSLELSGAFFRPQNIQRKVSLWRTPTQVLQEQFGHEWNNPNSDVREALPWCDLPHNERMWRSIEWQIGGREEIETVAPAFCKLETEWQHHEKLTLSISASESSKPENRWLSVRAMIMARTASRFAPDHRLSRAFDRIEERNQGVFNVPNGHRNAWRMPWVEVDPFRLHRGGAKIRIQINPLTQHERLEAALLLRDWLSQHAPDLLSDWFPDAA